MKKFTPVRAFAFTLVELLVSTTIIALLMVVLLSMTNQTSRTWRYTTEKVEKFQSARDGFESMTRRLSQATLNTYWDYVDQNGRVRTQFLESFPNDNTALSKFIAQSYGRMAELRFVSGPMSTPSATYNVSSSASSPPLEKLLNPVAVPTYQQYVTHGVFFQAPLGIVTDDNTTQSTYGTKYGSMDNLLNTWGYFVETDDYDERPAFITPQIQPLRWRSRLKELRVPCEKMGQYDLYTTDPSNDWFQTLLKIPNGNPSLPRPVRVLAENVTALIIWPKLSAQDEYARTVALTGGAAQSILCPYYAYTSNPLQDTTVNPARPRNRNAGVMWNSITSDDVIEKGGVNPINQLPPVVQVTMIAIDERSAKWLAEVNNFNVPGGGSDPKRFTLGFDLSDRFLHASKWNRQAPWDKPGFQRDKFESYMDQDIDEYCKELTARGVTYRVFSTNVSIRGAKWSRNQF
jgi:uncharacterized protein (TIGR02599 family)